MTHANSKTTKTKALRWCALPLLMTTMVGAGAADDASPNLARPTPEQAAWHDIEVGMFIHFAPNTWLDLEGDDLSLPLEKMNPEALDTDQWVAAAEAMGAGYIVFVAKHVGGFCMWQTETTDYSVASIPWRDGQGDVLGDLTASCRRRGMALGVYLSPADRKHGASGGGRCDTPEAQKAYNDLYRRQLTEVLSRYGEMIEVWFDGSNVVPVGDILEEHAPHAMVFQGPHATIRWVGNEDGIAPYPAWNSLTVEDAASGVATARHGNPDGKAWMPLECDARIRAQWFWNSRNADTLKSLDHLMEMYYKSVGRGAVLLLNHTPDPSGLIPERDFRRGAEFGAEVRRRFSSALAETSGRGKALELDLGATGAVDHVILMEDIREGERVRAYTLEAQVDGSWRNVVDGTAIGHKRIDRFEPVETGRLRLTVSESAAEPIIRRFAAFATGFAPGKGGGAAVSRETEEWVRAGGWSSDTFAAGEQATVDVDLTPHCEEARQYEVFFCRTGGSPVAVEKVILLFEGKPTESFVDAEEEGVLYNITLTGVKSRYGLQVTLRAAEGRATRGDILVRPRCND